MREQMKKMLANRVFYGTILIINLIGGIWGFWWYRLQFLETPLYLWPFVPNSPLAVLYFFAVLLLLLRNIRLPLLEGLAYFGLIKHGLWTVAIITVYHLSGYRHPENVLLWAGHLGMALQAVFFWVYYGLPIRISQAAIISGWYFFNDYLDYVVGIYPRVDTAIISVETVRNLAVSYSIVLTLLLLFTAWRYRHRKEPHEKRNS